MSLVQGWYPPSRENWEFIAYAWQFFPLVRAYLPTRPPQKLTPHPQLTAAQWLTDFYPQGKTSIDSRLNLPGKWAWAIMESVGPLTVLYCIFFLPSTQPELSHLQNTPLPWGNWTMAGIYTIHYVYRALICPLTAPSMSFTRICLRFWSRVAVPRGGLALALLIFNTGIKSDGR